MGNSSDIDPKKSALKFAHSFRVNEQVEAELQSQLERSGLTISEWMREAVMANQTHIVARPRKSADTKRLLFLANKTSNNINQLAHRANSAHLTGKIDAVLYRSTLLELEAISAYMNKVLSSAD